MAARGLFYWTSNPQGLVFEHQHNRLWAIEHGPRGGDELNLILKGKNYGWARFSYGREYWGPFFVGNARTAKWIIEPKKIYTPSIAPCDLEIYSGKLFKTWKGHLLTGSLKLTHLNKLRLKNNTVISETRLLKKLKKRIRSVKEGPGGHIWLGTDNGEVLKISPAQK